CTEGSGCVLHPNGNALTAVDDANRHVLRVTPSAGGQHGSVWYATPQPVAQGFTTTFAFRFSQRSNPPADGLAFVVQNSSLTALGGTGQLMGYNFPNN